MLELTQAVITDQELSTEDKALVEEVYERLFIFEEACHPYHMEARAVREVLRLHDPGQDDPDTTEPTLQLQTLKSTFNNSVADQMQNLPEPKIIPETPQQQETADDLQDAVRFVLYEQNSFESVHRRRVEDFFGPGTAITQITWDEAMNRGKGDIALIRWPIEAFLWDPCAEDIQDARALIKVSWHPVSWYEEHYPEAAPYINGEEGMYNGVGVPATQVTQITTDEPRAMLLEYWYRRYDAKKRRYTVNVVYCAGGALLDKRENVFAHGLYPFVVDVHSIIEGQPVGEGLVGELTPMMRYINRYAKYIDTNLRMSSKARMLTRRSSGIDRADLADWSKDLIEGNAIVKGQDWDWLAHAPLPAGIIQQMYAMQNDMKQDSGANQFTRGETMGGVTAGKAIAALMEAGGKIAGMRTAVLNQNFKLMVEQVLWLMAQFYDKERMVMITGRDGKRKQVNVGRNRMFGTRGAVEPPPYLVQVEIDRRNPLRIEAQNEMYMQAYTMAAQAKQYFPLSALFRMLNIDGKDRLLPVIEENEAFMQQMEQLQMQNQQMMEQLVAMQKENDSLKMTSTQMTNALANVSATKGGGFLPDARKVAQAGGGQDTLASMVDQARMAE